MVKGGFQYDFSYRTSLVPRRFGQACFGARSKRPPRIEVEPSGAFSYKSGAKRRGCAGVLVVNREKERQLL